jgi:hypothetical protein
VNQYVRILEQVVQDFPPCVGSQVRDGTALIRIEIDEEPAFFLVGLFLRKGPAPSDHITLRRFDLDYFATEISEKLGSKRGGNSLAIPDDLDRTERILLIHWYHVCPDAQQLEAPISP